MKALLSDLGCRGEPLRYIFNYREHLNRNLRQIVSCIAHELQDETHHTDALIKRILFLEGIPDLSKREPLQVGRTVEEMLHNNLAVELKVVQDLRNM